MDGLKNSKEWKGKIDAFEIEIKPEYANEYFEGILKLMLEIANKHSKEVKNASKV
jgi:hypothetical protein